MRDVKGIVNVQKSSKSTKSFDEELRQFVNDAIDDRQASQIALYFLDLNEDVDTRINEQTTFDIASLVKVPIMIAWFKKAQEDPQILTKTLQYNKKKIKQGHMRQDIPAEEQLQEGQRYTIEELIRRAIIFSDNQASFLLATDMDNEILNTVLNDFGISASLGSAGSQIRMSVHQYATFFTSLFEASYINKKMSEKALENLSKVTYKNGLAAGVPADIKIAHKFGERSWDIVSAKQLHDCGIIYYPDHPYLLCVMTEGYNFDTQSQAIKEISHFVYEHMKSF